MKFTHIGLIGEVKTRLRESESFWISSTSKYRKTDGTQTGKNPGPKLTLSSIEPLPTKVLLEAPNGTMYTLVSSNTKADTMVLRNAEGMEFTTHISKAQTAGYKVIKEF